MEKSRRKLKPEDILYRPLALYKARYTKRNAEENSVSEKQTLLVAIPKGQHFFFSFTLKPLVVMNASSGLEYK